MPRTSPWLLFGAALVVLALAVAHTVQRMRQEDGAMPATTVRQRAQAEFDASGAELRRDRAGIVERVRRLQQTGDHGGAMQLAGRYYPLQDAELLALYRASGEIVARQQRMAETGAMLATRCTPETAWSAGLEELRELHAPASALTRQALVLVRAETADVLPMILAQLRGDPGAFILKRIDPAARGEHEHHVQVHPDYAIALRSDAPDESLVCAWRLASSAHAAPQDRVELLFWFAPMASGRDVQAEALRYTPPPDVLRGRRGTVARRS